MDLFDSLRLQALGSGSRGNSFLVQTQEVSFLIDAGLSGKQVKDRLDHIGVCVDELKGILLTHEHNDHAKGLKVLAGRYGIPVYCNERTAQATLFGFPDYLGWCDLPTGSELEVGDVSFRSFPIPHDAVDPVGFVLSWKGRKLGFITDVGYATSVMLERLVGCDALVIESNYDKKLLQEDTVRPWSVKQRIDTRHGHLQNEAAAEIIGKVWSVNLRAVMLIHLSSDCNSPELARTATESVLREKQGSFAQKNSEESFAQVVVATQDDVSEVIILRPA